MDISLSKIQMDIAKEARRFLDKECHMEYVREMFDDERGFTEEIWAKMVEMDWTRVCIPEAYGGAGMDLMDLIVILEEMGRSMLPGPFFSTVLLAGEIVKEAGNDAQKQEYLSSIASGTLRGTLALSEPDSGADPDYVQMEANSTKTGFVLNGTKIFVCDAHTADFIVVAARTSRSESASDGISLFLVNRESRGISISPLVVMDGTRKQCAVDFKDVQIHHDSLLGQRDQGWRYLTRVLSKARVGLAAENVGGAKKCLEMATKHAKERIQFGQPIGTFQAVKHPCAQMFVAVESSRSLLYWAAWNQDYGNDQTAKMSALAAKVLSSENYKNVACGTLQILGGMGFTWEHDLHLYLRRAKANEVMLGDAWYSREEIIRSIEGEG